MKNIITNATCILFCILIGLGSCKQRKTPDNPLPEKGATPENPEIQEPEPTPEPGNGETPPPPPPAEKANLFYTSFTVSPQATAPGTAISVSVNIHNDGPGPSSGANNVYIRVQSETALSASDQELCRNFLSAVIPAGADQQITFQCTAPSNVGLYKLYPQFEGLSKQENYIDKNLSVQLVVR